MTGREYLKQIRDENFKLKALEDRIVELKNDMYRIKTIDYDKDRVDGGIPIDIGDRLGALQQLMDEANSKWDELIQNKRLALAIIFEIKDSRYQAVLEERYINMRSWDFIARRMQYEPRNVFKLHGKALLVFDGLYSNCEKSAVKCSNNP